MELLSIEEFENSKGPIDVDEFTNKTKALLEIERSEEEEEIQRIMKEKGQGKGRNWYEQLQKKGFVLLSLNASPCSSLSSMKGMYLIQLEPKNQTSLPSNKFSPGFQ